MWEASSVAALLGGGAIPIAATEIKKEADPFGSALCISITVRLYQTVSTQNII